MDEQATNDRHCVHSQLAAHGCDVIHLHNLTGDQEQDTDRGVPEGSTESEYIIEMTTLHSIDPSRYLPHDYGDQLHDGFIETVEEVLEGQPLVPHAPDDQTEAHREDHQAESIDSIHRPWHWDQLLPGHLLATIECEDGIIHCHLHTDYSLGIVRLELEKKKKKDDGLNCDYCLRQ